MRVDLFDFELPEDRIALRPVSPRDVAKLLHCSPDGHLSDHQVRDLPQLLRAGDCLVFNNTRVIPARLVGQRTRDNIGGQAQSAQIEITLLSATDETQTLWSALAKPQRRLRVGDRIEFMKGFSAEVMALEPEGMTKLRLSVPSQNLMQALAECGAMPLPPYIAGKRKADAQDNRDYQTVYAKHDGSVAAPTAGLHFTEKLLNDLQNKGIHFTFVTLHVGAGTFLPMKTKETTEHKMHAEWGELSAATAQQLNNVRANGGRIIAVGTTSLRLLETVAAQELTKRAGGFAPYQGETDIFITPGFEFRAIDALMTNFHLPKSTLFMLVAALLGLDEAHTAYQYAIANHYRFFSYGDSSLLWRKGQRV